MVFAFSSVAFGVSSKGKGVPKVRYIEPHNESEIDIDALEDGVMLFRWKSTPKPSGGRKLYKFILIKGYDYDEVFSKELDHDVYEIEIPSDLLEKGEIYTWIVKQKPYGSGPWSPHSHWSFKVKE